TANQSGDHKTIFSGITITTLIGALSISVPVLGFFCFLMLPLPPLAYRLRLDRKKTAIIACSAWACLFFFAGELSADMFLIAGMMLLGFLMGEGIRKDLPVEKIVAYACGIVLLTGIFGLILYGNISNLGLTAMVSDYIGKNLELTLMLYKDMGMPEENIRVISEAMVSIKYVLMRILPSLFAAGLLLSAWLNLLLAKITLRREKTVYPALGPLNIWKAPENLVWGVIGCVLMLVLPVGAFKMMGLNGIIIFLVVYFFQGIAVVSFYFETKRVPFALKVLLYSIIFIQQIFVLVIAGLGFFDIWLNFRRLGMDNNNKQSPLAL
ncbi:MAG: YybS family protein, partial [Desulfosalsimonadaceae bacterium]|nr:YybS family protein [Desulfosalsimonadaceae bacterium]